MNGMACKKNGRDAGSKHDGIATDETSARSITGKCLQEQEREIFPGGSRLIALAAKRRET